MSLVGVAGAVIFHSIPDAEVYTVSFTNLASRHTARASIDIVTERMLEKSVVEVVWVPSSRV